MLDAEHADAGSSPSATGRRRSRCVRSSGVSRGSTTGSVQCRPDRLPVRRHDGLGVGGGREPVHPAQSCTRPSRPGQRAARCHLVEVVDEVHARAPSSRPAASVRAAATPAAPRSSSPRPTSTIGATARAVGVVVLAGVLEHLLDGAAAAGQEDDARGADVQQDVLADRVLEVLRDRRRRTRSAARGRRTRSAPRATSAPSGHRSRTSNARAAQSPTDGSNAGTAASRSERLAQGAVVVAGQVGAEVRGLHRARAAAGRDGQPGRGPGRAQPGGVGVAVGAARPARARPSRRPAGGRRPRSSSASSTARSCSAGRACACRSWPVRRRPGVDPGVQRARVVAVASPSYSSSGV